LDSIQRYSKNTVDKFKLEYVDSMSSSFD